MFSQGRRKLHSLKNKSSAVSGFRNVSFKKRKHGGGIFDTAKNLISKLAPLVQKAVPVVQDAMKTGKVCIPIGSEKKGKGAKPVTLPDEEPKPNQKSSGQKLADKYLSGGVRSMERARKRPKADDLLKSLVTGTGLNIL